MPWPSVEAARAHGAADRDHTISGPIALGYPLSFLRRGCPQCRAILPAKGLHPHGVQLCGEIADVPPTVTFPIEGFLESETRAP